MQPTYLPWVGYFDLMSQVDRFVLLDDVAFSRQSWQQRNRIRTPNGLEWLTVPVHREFGALISEVRIDATMPIFPKKHLRSIEVNYARAPYFGELFEEVQGILERYASGGLLCQLNADIIRWMAERFEVKTETIFASSLDADGNRTERLVQICRSLGAAEYLTTPGSLDYLRDELTLFEEAQIRVAVHGYEPAEYQQVYEPFIPYASAIDLLFNCGGQAKSVLAAGRKSLKRLGSYDD